MFGTPFRVFSVRGIPIRADISVAFIALLIGGNMSQILEGAGVTEGTMFYSVLAAVLYLGSILGHEAAHAFLARIQGIRVMSITLFMFGGATQADMDSNRSREEFLVAIVGPASSGVLALLFLGLSNLTDPSPLAGTFAYLSVINGLLAGFNILPGFPLDGGRVLRAGIGWVTKKPAIGRAVARWVGMAVGVLFFSWAARDLAREDIIGAVWIGYIGLMVFTASRAMTSQESTRDALRALPVSAAMQPAPQALLANGSLSDALPSLRAHPTALFPVVDDTGTFVGTLNMQAAATLGQTHPLSPVRDAMLPTDQVPSIPEDATMLQAVEAFGAATWVLILRDEKPVGLVTMPAIETVYQQTSAAKEGVD